MSLSSEFFEKVIYAAGSNKYGASKLSTKKASYALTSLGAAGNTFNIAYLLADAHGNLLPSPAKDKWLVEDVSYVGYNVVCGVADRVYGAGCYFGGMWVCASRAGARKVDSAVCQTKNPPYITQHFWAVADQYVYNSKGGGSIKAGRMKLINEEESVSIPSWVKFI